MPGLLYRAGVRALRFGVSLAGLVNPKLNARNQGAAAVLARLAFTPRTQTCYWMHCASVGEFEQGRPVWDAMRRLRPGARFVLTFFSPSGVEWFEGRNDVGEVYYLPWDVGSDPGEFVGRLSPKLALFVKYEWWLGFHAALRAQGVPTVLFSVAFRQNQPFFRPWHPLYKDYREALSGLGQVFVQTANSQLLLHEAGYAVPVRVIGDTRLDRTLAVRDSAFSDAHLDSWTAELRKGAGLVLVAGSTWPRDEALLAALLESVLDLYLVVAPHEITDAARSRVVDTFRAFKPLAYTSAGTAWSISSRVVVLDVKGVLAKAYRYGDLAYVGGGFGAGIHNTLEPIVYGVPVAIGPKYARFDEAIALVAAGIVHAVRRSAGAKSLRTKIL